MSWNVVVTQLCSHQHAASLSFSLSLKKKKPPLSHLTGTAINFFSSSAVRVNGFICGQWELRDKGDNIIKVFNSMPEQLSPELMIISWLQ